MTQDADQGMVEEARKREDERKADAPLARTYAQAAAGDAWHERKSGGPAPAGRDPTLAATPEVPDVPPPDVVEPDPADGEAPGVTTGNAVKDAELSGLEPGEAMAGKERPAPD